MRKLTLPLIALGIFLPALCGCESGNGLETATQNERRSIELDNTTRSVAKELNDFYLKFTTDAVKYADSLNEGGNVVVSPLSASMVLAMLANGVDADLQQEIAQYLGTSDLSALNSLSNILLKELPTLDNQSELSLANSIWVNNQYKLTNAYTELMTTDYMADVKYEDFNGNPSKLLKKINAWCSDKTDGQINEFFDNLDPNTMAILLNAMNFKGAWKENIFNKENTEKQTFHGAKGDSEVDMMQSYLDTRSYNADENFEIFYLDFGNKSFNMTVVVPNETLSISDANQLLSAEELSSLRQGSVLCQLAVYLPRFKADTKMGLDEVLRAGQLSALTGNLSLYMYDPAQRGAMTFKQAACIEIDETGAKVAAVTSGEISNSLIMPGGTYTVKVDRPFYFFIKESSTGACLLSGRISDL